MEVKLKAGDSLNIPEGCKAVIKDNVIVFEREEEEEVQEFKDGDVLVTVVHGQRHNAFIYKSTDKRGFHSYYVGINTFGDLLISCSSDRDKWGRSNQILSHATEEEKQTLFDKMKEEGLQWNAEKKEVEKVRWRAGGGGFYYFVDEELDVVAITEDNDKYSDLLWNNYNYFCIKEQAEEAARRIKEVLLRYHEEIGE